MKSDRLLLLTISMVCLLVAGCGGSPSAVAVKSVPASGVVTYQGKPLDYYALTCIPPNGQRAASGKTDAEGRFSLSTNASGDGAVPGTHKVILVHVGPEITQEPGKEEIQEPPPAKVSIPDKYTDQATTDLTLEIPAGGSKDLKLEIK